MHDLGCVVFVTIFAAARKNVAKNNTFSFLIPGLKPGVNA
jgi:hypothetical protein